MSAAKLVYIGGLISSISSFIFCFAILLILGGAANLLGHYDNYNSYVEGENKDFYKKKLIFGARCCVFGAILLVSSILIPKKEFFYALAGTEALKTINNKE